MHEVIQETGLKTKQKAKGLQRQGTRRREI